MTSDSERAPCLRSLGKKAGYPRRAGPSLRHVDQLDVDGPDAFVDETLNLAGLDHFVYDGAGAGRGGVITVPGDFRRIDAEFNTRPCKDIDERSELSIG